MSLATFRLRQLPEWQQDALIVASSVATGSLLYLTGLYPLYVVGDTTPVVLRAILFGVICVAELFRRRAPGKALAAGILLLLVDCVIGVSTPTLIVLADLLYAATLYGSRRLSRDMIPIAALSAVGAVVATMILAPDWRATVVAGLAALPFVVIPVWWATNIRQHQEIAEVERTNAAQLAKISKLDRTAAIAAERARMARDLHDVIAGHLSAIAINSEAALSMRDAMPDTARAALKSVRENSVQALDEMRSMINLLRAEGGGKDETTAPTRLAELSKLVESARASGMQLDMHSELDDLLPLPAAVDLTAYRIAQEALTNAMKHAPHTRARVEIRHTDGVLTVEVVNELTAQPGTTSDTGTGLLNMHERAAAVGGSVSAGPSESGWRVRAVLPIAGALS